MECSRLLEAHPGDLELVAGSVQVRGAPSAHDLVGCGCSGGWPQSRSAARIVPLAAPETPHDPALTGTDHIYPAFHTPSFHCHGVEVTVDEATGRVDLLRYAVAQDVGNVLVRGAVEGQVEGGVAQGIGMALYEEVRSVDGFVINPSLHDYGLPTIMEVPPIEVHLVEHGDGHGHGGAKGVGEPPVILPGAAIANAVSAAIGSRCRDLPISRQRVLALVESEGPRP